MTEDKALVLCEAAGLSPMQKCAFMTVLKRPGAMGGDLARAAYDEGHSSADEWAKTSIYVAVFRANQKLRSYGVRIYGRPGHKGYYIEETVQ